MQQQSIVMHTVLPLNIFIGLSRITEEARFLMELLCCTTMRVLILPGRHKPCCVNNFIGTSSSILRTVRTWHRRTFSCFQKWSTLLVKASQMMKTWRMLSCHGWITRRPHGMKRVHTKAENYKPRFPISSGAPCALASLFTSVQHFLEMLVHYLVTLSYKPVQMTSLHICSSIFLQRPAVHSQSQPELHHATRHTILSLTIHKLVPRYDKCLNVKGDYVE